MALKLVEPFQLARGGRRHDGLRENVPICRIVSATAMVGQGQGGFPPGLFLSTDGVAQAGRVSDSCYFTGSRWVLIAKSVPASGKIAGFDNMPDSSPLVRFAAGNAEAIESAAWISKGCHR